MDNPFKNDELRKVYNRILDLNPFKDKTKAEILEEKKFKLSHIEELKELLESMEQLISDSRYVKIRKLRQEQLDHNINLLKTLHTIDPKISEIQARISTLEEELDMVKVIKTQIERIESETGI